MTEGIDARAYAPAGPVAGRNDRGVTRQRPHYAALDGLRGLAAISVLLFHLGHWQGHPWLAANAGLAVDFFFCLSGYVLSVAYRETLDQGMATRTFAVLRLVRLMPLVILGTLISAAYLAARIVLLHDTTISVAELARATAFGLLCLPMLDASRAIGGPQVFPLNGPQYTLFLEIVVNIAWAALRRIDGMGSALAIVVAGYALMALVGIGGDEVASFWTGLPRVFGAFYAGVGLYHAQSRFALIRNARWRFLFWPLLGLSALLFYWPQGLSFWVGWSWSLIVSPLLVLSGAHVVLRGRVARASAVLGALSFPVYALHYPIFVWINAAYQAILGSRSFAVGTGLALPGVLIASWLILRWWDEPVRRAMTTWLRTRAPQRVANGV